MSRLYIYPGVYGFYVYRGIYPVAGPYETRDAAQALIDKLDG